MFPLLEAGNALVAVCKVSGAGGAPQRRPRPGPLEREPPEPESWKGRLLVLVSTSFPGARSPNTQRDTALRSGSPETPPQASVGPGQGSARRVLTRQGRNLGVSRFQVPCNTVPPGASEQLSSPLPEALLRTAAPRQTAREGQGSAGSLRVSQLFGDLGFSHCSCCHGVGVGGPHT